MIDIILLSIAAILIVSLEIVYDLGRWRNKKNDKPMSTILRAGLMVIIGTVMQATANDWIYTLACVGYVAATFWLLFDTTINIVRRKVLSANFYKEPYNPYYQPFHSELRSLMKAGNILLGKCIKLAHANLSFKDKILWAITKISHVIFYHGSGKSKWTFDYLFNKLPGVMELMIKGIAYGMAFYYLNLY